MAKRRHLAKDSRCHPREASATRCEMADTRCAQHRRSVADTSPRIHNILAIHNILDAFALRWASCVGNRGVVPELRTDLFATQPSSDPPDNTSNDRAGTGQNHRSNSSPHGSTAPPPDRASDGRVTLLPRLRVAYCDEIESDTYDDGSPR